MPDTSPSLYDSFAQYGGGVTLITVRDGEDDRFFIAGSVLTASVSPFTLAVSVGASRDALPAIVRGEMWTVNILAEQHLPLVKALTWREADREQRLRALNDAGAERSPEGPLRLPGALVTLWCSMHSQTVVNDQVLLVGEVSRGSQIEPGNPLLRWNHDFHTVAASRQQSF